MHGQSPEKHFATHDPTTNRYEYIYNAFMAVTREHGKHSRWLSTDQNTLKRWQTIGPAFIHVTYITFCEVDDPTTPEKKLYFYATSQDEPMPPPEFPGTYQPDIKMTVYRIQPDKPLIEQAFNGTTWIDHSDNTPPVIRKQKDTLTDFQPLHQKQRADSVVDPLADTMEFDVHPYHATQEVPVVKKEDQKPN